MRDYPILKAKGREDNKVAPSDEKLGSQKKNRFYTLKSGEDQQWSSHVPFLYVFLVLLNF